MPTKQYKPACETCSHRAILDEIIGPHVIGTLSPSNSCRHR